MPSPAGDTADAAVNTDAGVVEDVGVSDVAADLDTPSAPDSPNDTLEDLADAPDDVADTPPDSDAGDAHEDVDADTPPEDTGDTDVDVDTSDSGDTAADTDIEPGPELYACERVAPVPPRPLPSDCNNNGTLDEAELAEGSAVDCDGDGVLDECQRVAPGCVVSGTRDFVEYRSGNVPIIMTVPFGGNLSADDIPDQERALGYPAGVNTYELGEEFADAMEALVGGRPHMIFSNVHSDKLLATYAEPTAHTGHPDAAAAWSEFQMYVHAARRSVEHNFGGGLYINLVGASSTFNEIGYGISAYFVRTTGARLEHGVYGHLSGIWAILQEGATMVDLLRGSNSFGAGLEASGHEVFPSPLHPTIDDSIIDAYASGGYAVREFGSQYGGRVSGFQLNTRWTDGRDTPENQALLGSAMARAAVEFVRDWLNVDANHQSLLRVEAIDPWASEFGDPGEFRLVRDGDITGELAVPIEWGGSADPGSDFEPIESPVVFAAGETTVTISLVPRSDSESEGPEFATLRLGPTDQTNLAFGSAEATIRIGDSSESAVTMHLSEVAVREEGESVELTLTRDICGVAETISVDLAGSVVSSDVLIEGAVVTPDRLEVEFNEDVAEVTLTIEALGDSALEGRETLTFATTNDAIELAIDDSDVDESLLGWWSTARQDNVHTDLSGRGHDLSMYPADDPTPVSVDGDEAYLSFDGVEHVGVLPDIEFGDALTLMFEFRADPDPDAVFSYIYGHSYIGRPDNLQVYLAQGGLIRTALRGRDDPDDLYALDVVDDFRDGEWHHYALTVNVADGGAEVFVDGVSRGTALRGQHLNPTWPIVIGNRSYVSENRHWNGDLANLRLYGRELTVSEIDARR